MTGLPAPTPLRGGQPTSAGHGPYDVAVAGLWPPALLPGLWVGLGDWHTRRRVWLKLPAARFTCRHGCLPEEAFGAHDVAAFTESITTDHARACPGPPQENTDG